jgi:hypothetical protein
MTESHSRMVRTVGDLVQALTEGAVLTLESQPFEGGKTSEGFVLREADGRFACITGNAVIHAIHRKKIRSIRGSKPTRYELISE